MPTRSALFAELLSHKKTKHEEKFLDLLHDTHGHTHTSIRTREARFFFSRPSSSHRSKTEVSSRTVTSIEVLLVLTTKQRRRRCQQEDESIGKGQRPKRSFAPFPLAQLARQTKKQRLRKTNLATIPSSAAKYSRPTTTPKDLLFYSSDAA